MVVSIILGIIWALLMWRSVVCEYRYYAAVKLLEPDVWHQLGSPSWIKAPMVFVSPRGAQLLDGISHETVRGLARPASQIWASSFGLYDCGVSGLNSLF